MKLSWRYLKRFLNNIIIVGPQTCWEWQGRVNQDGYGTLNFKGTVSLAHRLAWIIHSEEEIPHGKQVLHTCDNRKCMNPNHLYIGDHLKNMRDMVERGRGGNQKGEKNGNCKLSEKDVVEIKSLLAKGKKRKEIASKYKIAAITVDRIKYKRAWSHV